jgi:hypothetical protein
VRFYGTLKEPAEHESDISSAEITDISCRVSPCSILGVFADTCHIALVDESESIRTEMEMSNGSDIFRSARDALYDTTP